jgi:hypothetical protein
MATVKRAAPVSNTLWPHRAINPIIFLSPVFLLTMDHPGAGPPSDCTIIDLPNENCIKSYSVEKKKTSVISDT